MVTNNEASVSGWTLQGVIDSPKAALHDLDQLCAENEQLRERVLMLLRCYYDEHQHNGSLTCFDIQSPADEWESAALFPHKAS